MTTGSSGMPRPYADFATAVVQGEFILGVRLNFKYNDLLNYRGFSKPLQETDETCSDARNRSGTA